jgi:hypothetical protein
MANIQHHNHYFTNFTIIFILQIFFSFQCILDMKLAYILLHRVSGILESPMMYCSLIKPNQQMYVSQQTTHEFGGNLAHIHILCPYALTWSKWDSSLISQVIDRETYAVMNKLLSSCIFFTAEDSEDSTPLHQSPGVLFYHNSATLPPIKKLSDHIM